MRQSKFSEHQIIAILKAVEAGRTVRGVCQRQQARFWCFCSYQVMNAGRQSRWMLLWPIETR